MAQVKITRLSRFRLFFFLMLLAYGVFMPYQGLYLIRRGLGGAELAVLLGIMPLVKIIAQPLWGMIADIYRARQSVLSLTLIGMGVSAFLFLFVQKFWAWFILIILFSIFESPSMPLATAITIDYLENRQQVERFGELRMWGSLSFVIASVVMGYLFLDRLIVYIPLVFAVIEIIAGVLVLLLPHPVSSSLRLSWGESMTVLKKDPMLVLFLLGIVLIGMTMGVSYQYVPIYLGSLGAAGILIGVSVALSAVPEIPLMANAARLLNRFRLETVLLFGLSALPLRWLLYALVRAPLWLFPVHLLHGFAIMGIVVAGATYVAQRLPGELRATGQGLYTVAFSGIGPTLGLFGAGFLSELSNGMQYIWLSCAVVAVMGVFVVGVSLRNHRIAEEQRLLKVETSQTR